MKTTKSISKRFVKTKKGAYLRIKAGQDHFNSRESGNVTRAKRREVTVHHSNVKTIKHYL